MPVDCAIEGGNMVREEKWDDGFFTLRKQFINRRKYCN
jgi:hypothetical protein